MTDTHPKADLQRYLQASRDALLWKLDGLSEYDVRRPLTSTGTNLLGLVKHAAGVELGYFGETFQRPFDETPSAFTDDAEPNADMWAAPEESREDVVALYQRVAKHADRTIAALPLDAVGKVPWWPGERGTVTLHQILVHVIADLQRHAGHADIVRELIDGAVGLRAGNDNMPEGDRSWWTAYRERLEQVAREAGATAG
ncbi:DinB family protein [Streptomyces pratensis]|uniref:DinB family protein n=1 Tax=Streptomyces pratensis TaxID=1169025 RepID=UPI0030194B2C